MQDREIPRWNGEPQHFDQYEREVRWFVAGTPDQHRHQIVARLVDTLPLGMVKSVAQSWEPETFENQRGTDLYLQRLRASLLTKHGFPEVIKCFKRYQTYRRVPEQSMGEYLIGEDKALTKFLKALQRLRDECAAQSDLTRLWPTSDWNDQCAALNDKVLQECTKQPNNGQLTISDIWWAVCQGKEAELDDITTELGLYISLQRGWKVLGQANLDLQGRASVLKNSRGKVEYDNIVEVLWQVEENLKGTDCDERNRRNGLCGTWQQDSVEFDRTQNNLTEELVRNCQDITAIENGSGTDYQTHIHEDAIQPMMHMDKAHVSGMAVGEDGPIYFIKILCII